MTTSIPLGFHTFSISFVCAGSTHNVVTTCSGKNNTFLTAATINAAWRTALTNGSTRPFNAANLTNQYTVVQTKVLANIGGLLQVDVNSTAIVGSGAVAASPMNTAILVNKPTGLAGRRYRGRMFVPPTFAEGSVSSAAIIDPAAVTAQQALWTAAFNDIKLTQGIDPVLLHEDSLALVPTAISNFVVGGRLGTIGRRLRR